MENTVVIAIISFVGTCIGTFGGILTANKLSNYRIQQLEIKVDKHNTIIERTFKLEGQMTEVIHDIKELKGK